MQFLPAEPTASERTRTNPNQPEQAIMFSWRLEICANFGSFTS